MTLARSSSTPRSRLSAGAQAAVCALMVVLLACGCSDSGQSDGDTAPAAASGTIAEEEDAFRPVLSLIDALPSCDIDHRGLLLDMGADALGGRYGRSLQVPRSIVACK